MEKIEKGAPVTTGSGSLNAYPVSTKIDFRKTESKLGSDVLTLLAIKQHLLDRILKFCIRTKFIF